MALVECITLANRMSRVEDVSIVEGTNIVDSDLE